MVTAQAAPAVTIAYAGSVRDVDHFTARTTDQAQRSKILFLCPCCRRRRCPELIKGIHAMNWIALPSFFPLAPTRKAKSSSLKMV